MKFGIGRVGGIRSDVFLCCVVFFLMFLSRFDCLGGGMECVLVHSPSKLGIVTPSEGYVNGMSSGGVGYAGIMTGVFALVTRWCVCGANQICVGDVGVDDVWVIFVVVGVPLSTVVPNVFTNLCKASPCRTWKV